MVHALVRVQADPAEIHFSAPTVTLPANYILESDPNRSTFAVRVASTVTRLQFCPQENLLLPCPAQLTPVRWTATLTASAALRPVAVFVTNVTYSVAGNANFEVEETLRLDPDIILSDTTPYSLRVTIEHVDDLATGVYTEDRRVASGPHTIAHLSGELRFGDVNATLQSLVANPVAAGASQWNLIVASGTTAEGHAFAHSLLVPPPLLVLRDKTGGLTVQSGAVHVLGAGAFDWAGWQGQRGLTRLSTNGLVAQSISLTLPPGVGWRPDNERRLRSVLELSGGIPLDTMLNPVGPASGTVPIAMEFFSETYPVEFSGTTWGWSGGALSLVSPGTRFVRAQYYQDWQSAEGDIPESNDGFWFLLRPNAVGNLVIRPGLAGGISAELRFTNGDFFTHFPRAAVRAPTGGLIRIENNRVVPDASRFDNALAFVLYGKGCRDPGEPGASPQPLQGVQVGDVSLQFTPSAGLWAEGELTPTSEDPDVERHLEIGRTGGVPTHRTDAFVGGRFYMPGAWIPHQDGFDSPLEAGTAVDEPGEDPMSFNPARYLLSGVVATNGFALEHPGTEPYSAGHGDYAGMNLRAVEAMQATSAIAGLPGQSYPLTTRSKYYARQSGVSGIHESAAGPAQLPAYGYDMTLSNFGLSFLSNEPHDSRIDGAIQLPHPSALTQSFERLLMSCCGNLTEGQIAEGDDSKTLEYWSATRIETHSLRFTHDPNDPCDTGNGLLELGVTAEVAHLDVAPPGFLYPRPNGTLVAMDALGRESHLVLPAVSTLAGYPFTAVRRGYFNDNAAFPAGPGWISLAGLAGVSFFRDLTVHAQVLGSPAEPEPPLFVKAGWATAGNTFFNTAGFDEGHRGYPPSVTATAYQTNNLHLPRAEQVWFGTVPFNYEVRFDSLTRSFGSPAPVGIDLIVLDVDSRVERLNAELADLRFSAFLDLSLLAAPEFLAEQGASWITGQIEETAVNNIRRGLDELAKILDAKMTQLLDDVVLPAVENAVVVPLVDALPIDGDPLEINSALSIHLGNPLRESLQGLAEFVGQATNLTERASETLSSAVSALQTVRNVLLQLQQAEDLIVAGLQSIGIDSEEIPPELLEEAMNELEHEVSNGGAAQAVGRLVEIRQAIQELEQSIGSLVTALEAGQQFFEQLQDTVLTPIAEYTQLAATIDLRLGVWLRGAYAADPLGFSPDELRARVRQEIRDAFAESSIASNLQAVFRSWLYNTDAAVRQALDTAFQALNDQITTVAIVVLDEVASALQPVKTFSSVVESINWDGHAQIRGDRLSLLRLDNRAVVNLPTPLPGVQVPVEFTGFYEYRELTSDGPVGCAGGDAARIQEILLSSSAGPASMFGAGNELTISTKFTRNEDGEVLQWAGSLEMERQGPELQVIGLSEFSATLSVAPGAAEFYLSAFCRGHWSFPGSGAVPIPRDLAGGALIGRTCSFDAFSWDPLAESVLGGPVSADNAFTGVYLFGEATIPFADVGCIMSGSLSAGARIFINDPDFDFQNLTVGGRLDGEVSGDFLCLARLRGSAFLQGSKVLNPPGPFRFDGGAEVSGSLGICPFCIELGGDIAASYIQGDGWHLND